MMRLRYLATLLAVTSLLACGDDDDGGGAAGAAGGGQAGAVAGGGGGGKGGVSGRSGHGGAGASGAGAGGTSAGGATAGTSAGGAGGAGAGGATAGANAGGANAGGANAGGATAGTNVGGGSGAAGAPVTPTVSSWMGVNVSGDLPRVDVAYQLRGFEAGQKDTRGYPAVGTSGKSSTDIGFVLPTGTYRLSYRGDGALGVSGIGQVVGAVTTVGDEHRAEVAITGSPGQFGQFLTLAVTNGPGQSVTDIRLLMPGVEYGTTQVFLPQFLSILSPFRTLRFMDWEATNNSTLVDWKDRPDATHFGRSDRGEPWEHLVALINQTGKDAWVTVPELASDAYVEQMATFLATNLDFGAIAGARAAHGFTAPFELLVETSNETWNGSFSARKTLLAEANQDPARYPGTYDGAYGPGWMAGDKDLMKVGQVEADRLVKYGAVFRQAFAAVGQESAVAPVLAGWALGAVYSDVGLRFIQAHHGELKDHIRYVATAPYFAPDASKTGSLADLFAAAEADIAAKDATFADFATLVAEYGLKMSAYEGGQHITGEDNLAIKHLAQHDRRMHDAYTGYFALWQKHFGSSLFAHFTLAGTPGIPEFVYQYGFWGALPGVLEDTSTCGVGLPTLTGSESVASVAHFCPKYRALVEQVP